MLSALHKRGYVHGNLTPETLLLVFRKGNPHILLSDLGQATYSSQAQKSASVHRIASQRNISSRPETDISQLGSVLYDLLTGKSIHASPWSLPLPSERNPILPSMLDDILIRMLQASNSEYRPSLSELEKTSLKAANLLQSAQDERPY